MGWDFGFGFLAVLEEDWGFVLLLFDGGGFPSLEIVLVVLASILCAKRTRRVYNSVNALQRKYTSNSVGFGVTGEAGSAG